MLLLAHHLGGRLHSHDLLRHGLLRHGLVGGGHEACLSVLLLLGLQNFILLLQHLNLLLQLHLLQH